ncbi:hypothetical protein AAFF_G00305680 [Aldrovandia affinis]|uniref:Uncharacterized protein n=1 Tax=Aldrovandia affinis TaxID=143900 RepID=A0AAD7SP83_9TELE|nr:hypothetical protein AAFF_G00305680 [Aldrovandia affinis]
MRRWSWSGAEAGGDVALSERERERETGETLGTGAPSCGAAPAGEVRFASVAALPTASYAGSVERSTKGGLGKKAPRLVWEPRDRGTEGNLAGRAMPSEARAALAGDGAEGLSQCISLRALG